MALFNYAAKEIVLKIVYYGPGLSGKTTNLEVLHRSLSPDRVGKLISLSTEADRTLFFDFLPVELGKINDFNLRFQLYTVPGQVRYNSTRRLVLKGADAVVFVADSQRIMREQNLEGLQDMRENLIANNIDPDEIPIVFQYNKRDLKDILSVQELNEDLNKRWHPYIEAIAIHGIGVKETFKAVTRLLLKSLREKYKMEIPEEDRKEVPPSSQIVEPQISQVREDGRILERLEDIYNEFKRLSERIERIERHFTENKEQKIALSEDLQTALLQLQKAVADLSKSQRELMIQIRTVYDILNKARLEKKGLFF